MAVSKDFNTAMPWQWEVPLALPAVTAAAPSAHATTEGLAVWFAGVLYERDRAVAEVSPLASDAQYVLAAYQRHGRRAISLLRGEFAVAIADVREGRTLVARDHAGLQPLFYRVRGHRAVFGPWAATLSALDDGTTSLNRPAIADALCRRFPSVDETFFENVQRVPGGWLAVVARGRVTLERYWDPVAAAVSAEARPADAEELEDARRRAVRRAVGQEDVSIFLSGGLDSVSIAAAAVDDAAAAGRPLPLALSLGIGPEGQDERDVQRAVAAALGMRQRLVEFDAAVGNTSLIEQSLATSARLSSPLENAWAPPYTRLAAMGVTEGRRIVLTGMGGDEFFSSSRFLAADYLRRGDVSGARDFIRTYGRSHTVSRPWWSMAVRPILSAALQSAGGEMAAGRRARRILAGDPAWLTFDAASGQTHAARARLSPEASPWHVGFAHAELQNFCLAHAHTYIELENYVEFGAAAGVSFRHPYLDPDLVDVLCRTPAALLNRGGWLKGVLRQQLAERFPACGFGQQQKLLAGNVFAPSLFGDGAALRRLRAGLPALSAIGLVHSGPAVHEISAWMQSPRIYRRAYYALSVEAWVAARLEENQSFHSQRVGVAS